MMRARFIRFAARWFARQSQFDRIVMRSGPMLRSCARDALDEALTDHSLLAALRSGKTVVFLPGSEK